jgi:hypothetical protein
MVWQTYTHVIRFGPYHDKKFVLQADLQIIMEVNSDEVSMGPVNGKTPEEVAKELLGVSCVMDEAARIHAE